MLGGGFCVYFALPRSDPHGADLAYNDGSSRIGTRLCFPDTWYKPSIRRLKTAYVGLKSYRYNLSPVCIRRESTL
jgi:hypothetical protein